MVNSAMLFVWIRAHDHRSEQDQIDLLVIRSLIKVSVSEIVT